jgi:predicted nucleic-acid-binding Zn-ribbon protein
MDGRLVRAVETVMKDNSCPKCSSNQIIHDAEVRDYDASSYRRLSVHVALRNPEGGFFKKTSESGELRAAICGECGYTELYATNYQAMLKAGK